MRLCFMARFGIGMKLSSSEVLSAFIRDFALFCSDSALFWIGILHSVLFIDCRYGYPEYGTLASKS